MTEKTTIAGIDVSIVSDEEAEQADAVACMRKGAFSPFTDNLEAQCSACGETVIHRPHVPMKPPKICLECAVGMMGDKQ